MIHYVFAGSLVAGIVILAALYLIVKADAAAKEQNSKHPAHRQIMGHYR